MIIDRIGIAILLGIILIVITLIVKPKLLKGWGWVKVFGIGGSIYVIISSLYYSITGVPFMNDPVGFYRFLIALGAGVYIIIILDFYGIKIKKKKKKSKKKSIQK